MLTTSATTPELADRLRLAVTRTARRLRQRADFSLSPTAMATLATIERHGPLSPSELARLEGVQRPTIARAVGRMVDDGLVDRLPDAEDARGALLAITPEGRRALGEIRRRKTAYLAQRLDGLGPEDREVLERAAAVLERMLEEEE